MGQEVIITNTDLLVLKQWNEILIRIIPSLLGLLTKNNRALRARSLFQECLGTQALSFINPIKHDSSFIKHYVEKP